MNGKQKLYEDLIPSSLENLENSNLTAVKHEALVYRFYLHAHLERKRLDDCILQLRDLFFLSPEYILKVLQKPENHQKLKELIRKEIQLDVLRKKFPQFNWTVMRV